MHQLWESAPQQQICQVVVPGQVIFVECLSTAADPCHLLGCLCALKRFFVRFWRFPITCVRCWVLSRIRLRLCAHTCCFLLSEVAVLNRCVDRTDNL